MNKLIKRVTQNAYCKLPRKCREMAVKQFIRYKENKVDTYMTPTVLTFFVTARCNNRCAHCFYWQELNSENDELTLYEINQIASSLIHPVHLSLTGGEPFLREDIVQICDVFYRMNRCNNVAIATNGYLTSRIIESCRSILSHMSLETLSIQVSLDGLEDTHNSIRKVNKGFERAIDTIKGLSLLADEWKNFSVSVSITVQRKNIDEIEQLIDFLIPLQVPIRFALVRGQHFGTFGLTDEIANDIDPLEEGTPVMEIDQLERLFSLIDEKNSSSTYRFWSGRQQEKIRLSLAMLRDRKRQLPCYAGRLDAVLYSNGEVALCELTRSIGNIRDYENDFNRIWHSDSAEIARNHIRKCFCIHGCNLATSMLFTPKIVDAALRGM